MKKRFLLTLLIPLILVGCGSSSPTPTPEPEPEPEPTPTPSEEYDVSSYYDGYYKDIVSWENGEDLKQQLYTRLHDGYNALTYSGTITNWASNQNADQSITDLESVDLLYSDVDYLKTSTAASGSGWQREHAFPASLMTGKTTGEAVKTLGRATDFHNLFAAHNSGNTSRGNKNYGTADVTSENYVDASKTNSELDFSYDEYNFEPNDIDKGRVARAIFYMGVMYSVSEDASYKPLTIQEEYVEYPRNGEGYDAYAIGNLSTLITWSNTVSVSRLEMQHNESVYSYIPLVHGDETHNVKQGNRNPFVDYPSLVDYVYGDKKDQSGELKKIKPAAVSLKLNEKGIANYAINSATRSFKAGDTFTHNSYEIIGVNYDYSLTTDFSYEDTTPTYTFTSSDVTRGSKTLTINTPLNDISIKVKVVKENIESCAYHFIDDGTTGAALFEKKVNATAKKVNLNDYNWTVYSDNEVTVSNNKANGIKFGTGTKYLQSLYFFSDGAFKFDNKTKVTAVYVQCNASSGKEYVGTIKIGEVTKQFTVVYNKGESKIYGFTFSSALEGEISITFTNVDSAFYLKAIGIDTK